MRPRTGMSCVHYWITLRPRETLRESPFATVSSVLYSRVLRQSYGILGAAEGWKSLSSMPTFSSTIYSCRVGGRGGCKNRWVKDFSDRYSILFMWILVVVALAEQASFVAPMHNPQGSQNFEVLSKLSWEESHWILHRNKISGVDRHGSASHVTLNFILGI